MLSNKRFGEYLRGIRNLKGLSLRQVEQYAGVNYSYLAAVERGDRKATPAMLNTLSKIYKVDCLDLYEKAGYIDLVEREKIKKENDKKDIPILGVVKAGYNYLAQENIIGYTRTDRVLPESEDYFSLIVKGNSMEPVLYEDDLVIVHQQNDVESGQVAIVLLDNEEATIKKVVKYKDKLELEAFNSYYPSKILTSKDNFKIIGKVIEAKISKIFE